MGHESLKKWIRRFSAGFCIFTPDDAATNVYVILKGTVQLFKTGEESKQLVATLGPGDIIGERMLVEKTPYQHAFMARVTEASEILQFEAEDLPQIEKVIPDFKMRLLSTVTNRLNKANEFIRILQTSDNFKRVARYLRYFLTHNGPLLGNGVTFLPEEIAKVLQMEVQSVDAAMGVLVDRKAIRQMGSAYSVVHPEVLDHLLTK